MAKGSISKETITNQILAAFPGSFKYDKEIRIPIMEDGEMIQIKVTLTAAKVNVEAGGDTALPGTVSVESLSSSNIPLPSSKEILKPTEEEKANVANLISLLHL